MRKKLARVQGKYKYQSIIIKLMIVKLTWAKARAECRCRIFRCVWGGSVVSMAVCT